MRNEWRDNVWLIVELSIVFLAIWLLCVMFWVRASGLLEPIGIDRHNVYTLSLKAVPKESPKYLTLGEGDTNLKDFLAVVARIKANPNVEYVGFHNNGVPYNYNHYGNLVHRADINDSINFYANMRLISPEMIKVLGIKSLRGTSPEKMMEMLERGEVLLSNNVVYEKSHRNPFDLVGKEVFLGNDTARTFRVGDIVQHIRRTDYEAAYNGTLLRALDLDTQWASADLAIRVKPGKGKKFEEDFKNDASLRGQRNIYFSDLQTLDNIREGTQRSVEVDLNFYWVMLLFLLVTVFLGLIGSFWFRMQQRVGEIALRKVCGAKRGDIMRRVFSEGLILLLCATMVAAACVWPFYKKLEELFYGELQVPHFIFTEISTMLIMALGVIVSVWYPAAKAMRIKPAEAVKEE